MPFNSLHKNTVFLLILLLTLNMCGIAHTSAFQHDILNMQDTVFSNYTLILLLRQLVTKKHFIHYLIYLN